MGSLTTDLLIDKIDAMPSHQATRVEDAYEVLRTGIIAGDFEPGSRLKVNDLAKSLGVSGVVVREALTRLTEQGFAALEPRQGFRVMTLSSADLIDLTATRVHIECFAVSEAVRNASISWEADVVAAHHTLSHTPLCSADSVGTSVEWAIAHRSFHRTLIEGCGNRRLISTALSLRAAAEVYVQLSRRFPVQTARDPECEHREIVEAVLDRDAALASERLAHHIQRTTDGMLDWLQKQESLQGLATL
jgi:DNA-binding GntR family transcriptional regulator